MALETLFSVLFSMCRLMVRELITPHSQLHFEAVNVKASLCSIFHPSLLFAYLPHGSKKKACVT